MAAAPAPPAADRRTLHVCLDWTPNTNHAGLALAAMRGWFAEEGLDVILLSPHCDAYKSTPASRLADGSAQLACVPSESVVSWATWPGGARPRIKAVAALLQACAHAIVTRAGSGIDRRAAAGPGRGCGRGEAGGRAGVAPWGQQHTMGAPWGVGARVQTHAPPNPDSKPTTSPLPHPPPPPARPKLLDGKVYASYGAR